MKTNVWLRSLSKTYPRISKILQETSKPQTKSAQGRATRVRACNYIKIATGRPASTKNSNTHCAGCIKC